MKTTLSTWLSIGIASAVLWACPPEDRQYTPIGRRDAGPVIQACVERCVANTDCLAGFRCGTQGLCEPSNPPPSCTRDIQCHARQSGWREECLADNACPANQACVGGAADPGWCARKPTTDIPCSMTGQAEMVLTRKDGSGSVTVCGLSTQSCLEGTCRVPCRSNGDCAGEYPFCNTQSGLCECSAGSCRTNASVCELGECTCSSNADCTVAADTCISGTCGCSSVAVCNAQARVHPGTQWSCE